MNVKRDRKCFQSSSRERWRFYTTFPIAGTESELVVKLRQAGSAVLTEAQKEVDAARADGRESSKMTECYVSSGFGLMIVECITDSEGKKDHEAQDNANTRTSEARPSRCRTRLSREGLRDA